MKNNKNLEKYKLGYELKNKLELIDWYVEKKDEGYYNQMSFVDIYKLINKIVDYMIIKYNKNNYGNISLDNLFNYCTDEEEDIFNCLYKSKKNRYYVKKDCNGNIINVRNDVMIFINSNIKNVFSGYICADKFTGSIDRENYLARKLVSKNMTLDQLLVYLDNYKKEELNYKELSKCVYFHNVDIELREKVLKQVAIKLICLPKKTCEFGEMLACKIIDEFNDKFNLNISVYSIYNDFINYVYNERSIVKFKKRVLSIFDKK